MVFSMRVMGISWRLVGHYCNQIYGSLRNDVRSLLRVTGCDGMHAFLEALSIGDPLVSGYARNGLSRFVPLAQEERGKRYWGEVWAGGVLCGMHLPKKVALLPCLDSDTLFWDGPRTEV